jgi:hypothetical protein
MRSGRLDGQLAAHGFAADKAGVRNLTDWFFNPELMGDSLHTAPLR